MLSCYIKHCIPLTTNIQCQSPSHSIGTKQQLSAISTDSMPVSLSQHRQCQSRLHFINHINTANHANDIFDQLQIILFNHNHTHLVQKLWPSLARNGTLQCKTNAQFTDARSQLWRQTNSSNILCKFTIECQTTQTLLIINTAINTKNSQLRNKHSL